MCVTDRLFVVARQSVCLAVILAAGLSSLQASENTTNPLPAEQLEFFEQRIRPVLVERCYPCHSSKADVLQGGLLLDSAAGALKGGRFGACHRPGEAGREPAGPGSALGILRDAARRQAAGRSRRRLCPLDCSGRRRSPAAGGGAESGRRSHPSRNCIGLFGGPSRRLSRSLLMLRGRIPISIALFWHDSSKPA